MTDSTSDAEATTPTKPARGTAPRRVRGYVDSYGIDRTCGAPDCATTLSRYNSGNECWRHAEASRS
jgi:hypothetical protein